ncbi:Rv1733c family protein [Actinoplanes sp. HUAS TT8]|uniref:Rv1733c family protein n=1 Tax=Actinoplanes sp. HUAS TT8 TaxID=3447453 RepID=UPI003F522401
MFRRRERNRLRRTSDRVESLLVFLLVLTFLAAAPLLAWEAGQASYRSDQRARQWERENLFPVEAVLAETATADTVKAVWRAPDGSAENGLVQATIGDPAGKRVPIWVNRAGVLQSPPSNHSPGAQAVTIGIAVLLCLAAGFVGLLRLVRAVIDRRRDRAWTREWREVGPIWSRDSGRY